MFASLRIVAQMHLFACISQAPTSLVVLGSTLISVCTSDSAAASARACGSLCAVHAPSRTMQGECEVAMSQGQLDRTRVQAPKAMQMSTSNVTTPRYVTHPRANVSGSPLVDQTLILPAVLTSARLKHRRDG